MTRMSIVDQKKKLVEILERVKLGDTRLSLTHYMKKMLIDNGYVRLEMPTISRGPGRPREEMVLTNKGHSLVNLSKSWKKAV